MTGLDAVVMACLLRYRWSAMVRKPSTIPTPKHKPFFHSSAYPWTRLRIALI